MGRASIMGSTGRSSFRGRTASKNSTLVPGANGAVAKLTAENLQKMGKPPSIRAPSERISQQGVSEAGDSSKIARSAAAQARRAAETVPDAARQAIPDFWQVNVRRNLRRCLDDKS